MFGEVPVAPVVVPLAAVVWVLLLWRLHRRGLLSVARAAVALALCVYVAGVVANTVFPIFLDKPGPAEPWTWHAHLWLSLLSHYDVADAITNVFVFVPVGILVPLAAPRWPWWRVLAAAAAFSLAIEVTQYVTAALLGGGHIADINDLLFNVIGGVIGFALFVVLTRVPVLDRLADRFRWA